MNRLLSIAVVICILSSCTRSKHEPIEEKFKFECLIKKVDAIELPIEIDRLELNDGFGPGSYFIDDLKISDCCIYSEDDFLAVKIVGEPSEPDAVFVSVYGNFLLVLFDGKEIPTDELSGYSTTKLNKRVYQLHR